MKYFLTFVFHHQSLKIFFCSNCSPLDTSPFHYQQPIQHNHTFDFRKPELELAVSSCQQTRTNSVSQIQVEMIFNCHKIKVLTHRIDEHLANIPSLKHGYWWSAKWASFYEIRDWTCDGKCQLGNFVSHASLYNTKGRHPEAYRVCMVWGIHGHIQWYMQHNFLFPKVACPSQCASWRHAAWHPRVCWICWQNFLTFQACNTLSHLSLGSRDLHELLPIWISVGAPALWRSVMQIDQVSQEPLQRHFTEPFFPLEVHIDAHEFCCCWKTY